MSKKIATESDKRLSGFALGIALFISIILLLAAYSKFFYPSPKLKMLDQWVSLFELGVIAALFIFRKYWLMWLVVSLVFAAWSGYALYWFNLKLPCNCLGSLIEVPSAFSFTLDIIFFVLSLSMAYFYGATRALLYLTLLGAFLASFIGHGCAEWVFFRQILGMKKHALSAQVSHANSCCGSKGIEWILSKYPG